MTDEQTTTNPITSTTNTNQDEELIQRKQTETQLQNIQNEIRDTQPLTSELLPLSSLTASFQREEEEEKTSSSSFKEESQTLESKYKYLRKVRGDGNCYYRAFLYAVCENVLLLLGSSKDGGEVELNRLIELAKNSIDLVTQRGYDRSTIEMFYEELVDLFTSLSSSSSSNDTSSQQQQQQLTQSTLHTTLNEENAMSDYCTWYLRLLTACHLKSDPDRFIHFLDVEDCPGGAIGMDVPTFCSREVEPMGRECSMVQVLALAEVMGVRVVIEYMDGRGGGGGGLVCHEFGPEDAKMKIFLLYRPGHYDILYK
eukprot:CAMPEP_0185725818 /NCGR_PEP_ID=MMETSP1171-20130828/1982_1 /TAXON_ID=374046 /ORGANISM="Helicotheca tamensis, Strain CCMP826" /LENGTH=311 /DNA_ID=CAMNT_0028394037 /DNA_START=55 /DNA_END=990 /DNA_ORIENTATION=+